MGAADDIREGELEKYTALEEAGINIHQVEMMLLISDPANDQFMGNKTEKRYRRLAIKPNASASFKRSEIRTEYGFEQSHDVILKGAFPKQLKGVEILINENGQESASIPISVVYSEPWQFRAEIEKAESFLIDGEPYKYRDGGYLQANNGLSQWVLKLVRAVK